MLQLKALGKVGLYMSATEVHTSVLDSMPFSAFKRLLLSCYPATSLDDMPCAWLADAWVVLLQAHKSQLQRVTAQVAEKQSLVEVKQAEISKLEHRLTDSQQEVAAVHQEQASAVKANSAAAQVGSVSACCLAVVLQMHKSEQHPFGCQA
jgi:septal ring factor EnvC (AmiA/AmiB activator)